MEIKTINLFGYPFANLSYSEVLAKIDPLLAAPQFHYFVTLNPEILLQSEQNLDLKTSILKADCIFADGIGLILGAFFLTRKKLSKITGSDLINKILAQKKYSFYFCGAKPEVIFKAVAAVKKTFPQSKILGFHHGYYSANEEEKIILEIQTLKPDFILLGLGAPKQEILLNKLKSKLNHGIGIGIGGVFDVLSGQKKRAPKFLQKLGLEWLYRGIIEPKRIKRWFFIPKFLFYLFKHLLKKLTKAPLRQ
jgi:N-acetylglucosaminyldiphosphoundecaprenol N-acetyl-beta-D-mannosaminyltransferase